MCCGKYTFPAFLGILSIKQTENYQIYRLRYSFEILIVSCYPSYSVQKACPDIVKHSETGISNKGQLVCRLRFCCLCAENVCLLIVHKEASESDVC